MNKKTDRQIMSIWYLFFTKTRAFNDVLIKWNTKTIADKTFENLKTYMRTEHRALHQVGALKIRDSILSKASMLK